MRALRNGLSPLCLHALQPNAAGSWVFMNLVTKNAVHRLQWHNMQMNKGIVQCMNAFTQDAEEQAAVMEPVHEAIEAL